MSNVVFNSLDKKYKKKFGAVKNGEEFSLRLLLPCNDSNHCTQAWLVINKDGQEEQRFDFWATEEYEENCRWWEIFHTIDEPGLYWYRFEYETPFGTCRVSKDGLGIGFVADFVSSWQLTVYDKDFVTPDWLKGGVIYQIFPDRFYKSNTPKTGVRKDRIMRDDWGGEPYWEPTPDGKVLNNDYFGGDLKGIEDKLDYIKSLGVNCIYLNPIFEANSNHRYDTADYSKIDPLLGTEKDFKSLCSAAKKKGIHIILDGVFSHTGDDSIYFNKYNKYDCVGAYNSEDSEYYNWYKFNNWPNDYTSWWGITILPEIKEECPQYLEFINGKKGIIEKWLKAGADGYRLDVADELPDVFLDGLRERAKAVKKDSIIIGEVWEDASNKTAYSERRRYLLGDQLDSVMNYPFLNSIIDFVASYRTDDFFSKILSILENYPPQVVNVLMNPLGTHDTERIMNVLAGTSSEYRDRYWQSQNRLSDEQIQKGTTLLKIASGIQFTLPGIPSIYYGDEAGTQGFKDPFNRTCYPWGNENNDLINWYKFLGSLRQHCKALVDGEFVPISAALGCVAYARIKDDELIVVIANRNEHEISYHMNEERFCDLAPICGCSASGQRIDIPALSCAILGKGKWVAKV